MEQESALLEAFASLPALGKGWAAPAAGGHGARVTLQLSQRNLPANSQRKHLTTFHLNEAVLEAGEVEPSPPVEQSGVLLYAPSPSGRRTLVVRAGSGESSAGERGRGGGGGRGARWVLAKPCPGLSFGHPGHARHDGRRRGHGRRRWNCMMR